jgi:hypothetical protein
VLRTQREELEHYPTVEELLDWIDKNHVPMTALVRVGRFGRKLEFGEPATTRGKVAIEVWEAAGEPYRMWAPR